MKKGLTIALAFVFVAMLALTQVSAATSSTLANDLYAKLSGYGLTSADKVKIERYVADNTITDEQANTILAKADEAVEVMKNAGVTDVKKLSTSDLSKVESIAQSAANTVGLNLTFSSNSVKVYKDGKLIETVSSTDGKLAYTGNSVNKILAVSSVLVLALTAGFVLKNKSSKVEA